MRSAPHFCSACRLASTWRRCEGGRQTNLKSCPRHCASQGLHHSFILRHGARRRPARSREPTRALSTKAYHLSSQSDLSSDRTDPWRVGPSPSRDPYFVEEELGNCNNAQQIFHFYIKARGVYQSPARTTCSARNCKAASRLPLLASSHLRIACAVSRPLMP